jgi:hypothetical protein
MMAGAPEETLPVNRVIVTALGHPVRPDEGSREPILMSSIAGNGAPELPFPDLPGGGTSGPSVRHSSFGGRPGIGGCPMKSGH